MFVACAFAASAIAILMIGRISSWAFFNSIFDAIVLADFLNLIGRSTVPAFLIGVICCHEGLRVSGPVTVVPQAVTKAMLRAVAVTLIFSAAFTVLIELVAMHVEPTQFAEECLTTVSDRDCEASGRPWDFCGHFNFQPEATGVFIDADE